MTPKKEEVLLEAIRNKFPKQSETLDNCFWQKWEFNGHGSSNSINIKRDKETAYIRTDGSIRY